MLGLVSSLMLNCAPHLRKHELSSLFMMSMISMHNGKECWKGASKFVAFLYHWQLATNLH
jgi:hypothetical protein